jgi:hypothetical protein
MKRSRKALQIAAGHDRIGKSLFFHGEQFDCKVSPRDTGGGLCVYDTIRKKDGPVRQGSVLEAPNRRACRLRS